MPRKYSDPPRSRPLSEEHRWSANGPDAVLAKDRVGFREAKVVIARDRRTGQSRIVFGRKEIEQIRDGGNEKLQAFVVLYDPTRMSLNGSPRLALR